jgi:hypothetical protein
MMKTRERLHNKTSVRAFGVPVLLLKDLEIPRQIQMRSRVADKPSHERELFGSNRLQLLDGFFGGQDLDGDESVVSVVVVNSAVFHATG